MNTTELIELLKASEIGKYSGKPFQVEIFNEKLGHGRDGLVLHKDDALEFSSSGDSKEDPRLFLHIVGDNLETPDYWDESVKMAKSLHIKLECYNEKYYYDDSSPSYCGDPLVDRTCGPFTLPELYEKLINLRESEGE